MIDVNMHGKMFYADSHSFAGRTPEGGFVTYTVNALDSGSTTFYVKSLQDAERIAQGALELLKNAQEMYGEKEVESA